MIVPINGNKCKNADALLVEFYDKLNCPYPQYRNLDGLEDWLRDLSWINDDNVEIVIFNPADFLSEDAALKKELRECWISGELWRDSHCSKSVTISESGKTSAKGLANREAALLYANGLVRRVFGKEDAVKSVTEVNGEWLFAGMFSDGTAHEDARYVGVPSCFKIDSENFECKNIPFVMFIKEEKQRMNDAKGEFCQVSPDDVEAAEKDSE